MPEGQPVQPTAASGTPADPTTAPQAGTPTAPATPADANAQPTQPATDLEDLKKLRSEAANLRKRLKEVDDAKAAEDLAKLGELERANKQLETVTKQVDAYRGAIAELSVQIAAQQLGIRDPEVAATLIRGQLDIDAETGKPTNADELLKDLLKNKPYLKIDAPAAPPAARPNAGPTNPARGQSQSAGQAGQSQQPGQSRPMARFGTGQQLFQK